MEIKNILPPHFERTKMKTTKTVKMGADILGYTRKRRDLLMRQATIKTLTREEVEELVNASQVLALYDFNRDKDV